MKSAICIFYLGVVKVTNLFSNLTLSGEIKVALGREHITSSKYYSPISVLIHSSINPTNIF